MDSCANALAMVPQEPVMTSDIEADRANKQSDTRKFLMSRQKAFHLTVNQFLNQDACNAIVLFVIVYHCQVFKTVVKGMKGMNEPLVLLRMIVYTKIPKQRRIYLVKTYLPYKLIYIQKTAKF